MSFIGIFEKKWYDSNRMTWGSGEECRKKSWRVD